MYVGLYFELLGRKFVKDASVVLDCLELELIAYEGVGEVFARGNHRLEHRDVFFLYV